MKKLNLLYLGWLSPGSTRLQRMNGLKRLGQDVVGVDCHPFIPSPFLINRILHRLFRLGLPIKRINLDRVKREEISMIGE